MSTKDPLCCNEGHTKWFREARFGMFIHWGLYPDPARGEWVRHKERMSVEEYQKFFAEFDPAEYNPSAWAKAARNAGMKYAVLTAKHHDGFCLFDSKYTDHSAPNTKAARDLVKEFVEAFREQGLKVGLYYSLIDWHHEDYPAYGDITHPMRNNPEYMNYPHKFDRYLDYMHGQIRELCQNYGEISLLWLDYSYDDMKGETWKASELVNIVRSLQPEIIINNRLDTGGDGYGAIICENPPEIAGDFVTPEQMIPPHGIVDFQGCPVPWESCVTLNNTWGYNSNDHMYKTSTTLIRKLVECVSKNGNLLLNIGPNALGLIPEEAHKLLTEIGDWMKNNGESIYKAGMAHRTEKPEWGYYTQKEDVLYAHIFQGSIGALCLAGLKGKIKNIRLVSDGSEIKPVNAWNVAEYSDDLFINFGEIPHFTYPLPDKTDTVIKIILNTV